jgi:hypothetical protein
MPLYFFMFIWFSIELLSKDLRLYQQHSGVSQVRQRLKTQCCLHYNEEFWNQVNQQQIL